MFDAVTEICDNDRVVRYRIFQDGDSLTYAAVIDLWQTDQAFQEYFTSLLTGSAFDAFRWETPSLTLESANQQFEFVLVNTPRFASRRSDRRTFSDYFTDTEENDGVTSFPNIRKDATLVVPSPRGKDDLYGHLAAFVRMAPRAQVNSLWRVLGNVITTKISTSPIWVNTAGGGVAWLHVRVDSRPKYYSHTEYKTS